MSTNNTKLVEEKLEELYNSLMEKPLQVLDIFNNFFGEDKVDIQNYPSLEEFKSQVLSILPIYSYIPNRTFIDMDIKEWDSYSNYKFINLPEYYTERINNLFLHSSVKEMLSGALFSNIFILVHFPEVRITNENDRYVDIKHLWAKICILSNGVLKGHFTLNRSEYTISHIKSDYMHSHISGIPTSDFSIFKSPCLGSGPIKSTIAALNNEYNEDTWNMFCLELSKYVTVESLAGIPHRRLENIGIDSNQLGLSTFITYTALPYSRYLNNDKLKEFIRYFLNLKKLKFNYINNSYSIGMSFTEYIILISNEFIKWYNDQFNKKQLLATFSMLKDCCVIEECIISNGQIYNGNNANNIIRYNQYIGKTVCTFKNKVITVNITDICDIDRNKTIILNIQVALYILTIILKVLNYRYGRSKAISNQLGTEVRYL